MAKWTIEYEETDQVVSEGALRPWAIAFAMRNAGPPVNSLKFVCMKREETASDKPSEQPKGE